MIFNSTHKNKEAKTLITDLVGREFSFLETLKLKGISSKRIIIEDVSPNIKQYINSISDLNYANIELRKHGILVFINNGLKCFTWAIPYYQLVIYKTNGSSLHAQGRFIHLRNSKTFKENKKFFDKMMDEKIKYDQQYNFQNI